MKYVKRLCSEMDIQEIVMDQKVTDKYATNLMQLRMMVTTRISHLKSLDYVCEIFDVSTFSQVDFEKI
jgi:hypothetical protein